MSAPIPSVLVVGGGITGLVAARRLALGGAAVTLVEASDRWGGNLRGERVDTARGTFLVDHGPDSWVIAKPEASALCRELGLGGDLIETTEANRAVYLVHDGALRPMPEGLALGIPTRLRSLAATDLFSLRAKARMLLEPLVPKAKLTDDDISVGEFLERRIGREPTETLVAPLLGGIFAGDAYEISLRTAFPQFLADEAQGSLLLAAMGRRKKLRGKKPSAFHSLRGGVRQLIDALAADLAARPSVTLRLGAAVTGLAKAAGDDGRWTATFSGGATETFRTVLLTGPSWGTKRLLDGVDPTLPFGGFAFGSAATAFFAYPREAVRHPLDGTGFIAPAREGRKILAGTWVSSKWAGRAPEGTVLLRAFLGGKADGALVDASDDVLLARARPELEALLGITGEPIFTRVYRFKDASPNPRPGHLRRVAELREALRRHPGLAVAGNGYDGAGIPDCVRQADAAAAAILADR